MKARKAVAGVVLAAGLVLVACGSSTTAEPQEPYFPPFFNKIIHTEDGRNIQCIAIREYGNGVSAALSCDWSAR